MANEQNLRPSEHILTLEEAKKGGIRSGEVRRERRKMKEDLIALLNSNNSKGKNYQELVQVGLIANAIDKKKGGNPQAYALIAKMVGELEEHTEEQSTPEIELDIVDNSDLESELYGNE